MSCPTGRHALSVMAAFASALSLLSACSQTSAAQGDGLRLATWNLEWLLTPADRAELGSRCVRQQPRSDEHALPCTPGKAQPPTRTSADFDALARTAEQLRDALKADVVALQEVDGAGAARQVFRQGWKLDCFVNRAHPQKVGFAIREGTPYRCNGDLGALDIDGSTRAGADMTLYPGTPREVRLLSVHLKSGCFNGKLDRQFGPCQKLRQQVPVLEAWVDARVREGKAFAILGDFNRHLDKDAHYPAGPDESQPLNLFNALSDNEPTGAVLVRATEGASSMPCSQDDRHTRYIDDILVSESLAARAAQKQFTRVPFAAEDQGRLLSDHCPVVYSLTGLGR
ncbi:endonuclease/exonuclease/phosphatase family protein [Aquabacterium sp.]|uniref:endonuclease/exonuclease/phosphatase family protein n=1 Tax=Aquabacterium sp. TaxID=1872578 RepID=UPI002487FDE0|nr:endonuclease/exonuclease/phosphatase family protein [Aquabacterium sp.]MDI1257739.1 endonuclease/exonuclease/phosphatase family protein [Aquabacterium sp.]